MKIVHLNYYDIIGGAARAAYRIHCSLLKQDIDSEMWVKEKFSNDTSIKGPASGVNKFFNRLRHRIIDKSLVKLLKTDNKIIHSPSILSSRLIKYINECDADIIHLHWLQFEMISISDIAKIKKPIIWTLHDMWAFCGAEHYTNDIRWKEGYDKNNRPNYETGFDLNRWTWLRKKKYWKNSFHIVTPSKWLAKCVSSSDLMENWKVSVVPYPIDTNNWKPLDKNISRNKFNLPKDANLILFGAPGGGIDPRKGYDLLLKALEYLKIQKKMKNIQLVVFGQSKPKANQNLKFPIHYMGQIFDDKNLRELYSAADVMVIPSRQDNLPNTALEAQACGVPVVSFDIGGLPDIIEHQKTGYIAKHFDTKDFSNGIYWVLNNLQNKELNVNSRERILNKFSEKKVSNDYLNIYKNLLK